MTGKGLKRMLLTAVLGISALASVAWAEPYEAPRAEYRERAEWRERREWRERESREEMRREREWREREAWRRHEWLEHRGYYAPYWR